MSKRDVLLLLEDMLQSAQKIKRYTQDLDYDFFLADDKTLDAVVSIFNMVGTNPASPSGTFQNA